MIFKNKKFKTAMATLAILTIFGGTVSSAYAAELTNSQSISVNASVQRVELMVHYFMRLKGFIHSLYRNQDTIQQSG